MVTKPLEHAHDFMDHGGKVIADGLGMIPGVGEFAEGAQAELASVDAMDAFHDGDYGRAAGDELEAAEHAFKAIPGAHEVFEIPDYIEAASDTLDMVTGGDVPLVPSAMAGRAKVPMASAATQAFGHYAD